MSYVLTGIAFVVVAVAVLVWRTFQDGRVIADRPDRALVPEDGFAGRTGIAGGDSGGLAAGADAGSAGHAGGGDGGGGGNG